MAATQQKHWINIGKKLLVMLNTDARNMVLQYQMFKKVISKSYGTDERDLMVQGPVCNCECKTGC